MDPSPDLLHDWFLQSARRFPDRIAIEAPGEGDRSAVLWTYDEARAASQAIAQVLGGEVGPDDRVAIFLPRRDGSLYVAQLGVLRAGAAYLSLVDQLPDERISFLLEDSDARIVITDAERAGRVRALAGDRQVLLFEEAAEATRESDATLPSVETSNLAYVIYTSGTTGQPKGVAIEHRSICNLVASDRQHFGLDEHTRSVQSSSPVFDSSLEEIWLAWSVGGAIVVADDETARLGPDLVAWLREQRATVLCPTPTLLRAMGCRDPETELPDLDLVYVGGEAVPDSLLEVWGRSERPRFENGYGPTECTVTVTRDRLLQGRPVTIGRPVDGHQAVILDPAGAELPIGEVGELCFRGPGLARGYLNRPELTEDKFTGHPQHGRIYRTGDLGRRLDDGRLLCLGRADGQVKLRGYRIELEEVEAQMAAFDGIREAACRLQTVGGDSQLVGFVTLDGYAAGSDLGREQVLTESLRIELAKQLPPYMVPSGVGVLDRLPSTLQGKIDRAGLPELELGVTEWASDGRSRAPATPTERVLAEAVAPLLGVPSEQLDCDRDFFELGGDSVRAAEWVSILRDHQATRSVSVRDVYQHRSVAALALAIDAESKSTRASSDEEREQVDVPGRRPRLLVGLAQALYLSLAIGAGGVVAWILAATLGTWLTHRLGVLGVLVLAPFLLQGLRLLLVPFALSLALLVKRILMPCYRPGRYRAWSWWHLRHWIVQRTLQWVPFGLTAGTEFQSTWLRLLGARVGKRVHLHRGADVFSGAFELLEIGDDAVIGQDANLSTVQLVDHWFEVAPISVGARSLVSVRASVEGGASVGSDAELRPLSSLRKGERVPDGEVWDGVPASEVGAIAPRPELDDAEALARERATPYRHGLAQILLEELVRAVLGLPTALLLLVTLFLVGLGEERAFLEFLFDPLARPGCLVSLGLVVVLSGPISLLVSGLGMRFFQRVPQGVFSRYGSRYWWIWIRTGVLERAGEVLSGTMFWPWWLRLSGMRLGKNSEVSTITDVLPEQCSIGRDSFFADGIYFGGPVLRDGVVEVAPVAIGSRSFLGNHAVVEPSTSVPDDVLVGVCTVAGAAPLRADSSWFGHPPFELPNREVVDADRALTHDPGPFLYWNRFAWEASRFLLPVLVGLFGLAWLDLVEDRISEHAQKALSIDGESLSSIFEVPASFWWLTIPTLTALSGLAAIAVVCAAKWLLLGRVKASQHGLWSSWCCRWDFVYVLWARLGRGPLSQLDGTPMIQTFLRSFGVGIGSRVTLGRGFAHVVDPDMLRFEHGACVDGLFQAHTFEDRVLKTAPVFLRPGSSTRRGSVLMYGADLGAGCRVEPHTVVMKNERLEPDRVHEGVPSRARPVR